MNPFDDNAELTLASGGSRRLSDFAGQVRLIVNVASKCGLTSQFEALERLQRHYRTSGLTVLAFPSNDFLGQEPGSNADILHFCSVTYDISFPLFAKIRVTGPERHPLYAWLGSQMPHYSHPATPIFQRLVSKGLVKALSDEPLWNFEKFLVARSCEVVGRFAPDVEPNDELIRAAVEHEIARVP